MKIAILTQPLKSNYGGMLQAFALQHKLKDLGHDVTTIDRQPDARSKTHQALSFLKHIALKSIKNDRPIRFNKKKQDVIFKNTLEFIRQNIKTSEPINSTQEMQKHFSENSYNAIVVGSDQTWRPMYSPNIFNFYLDFLQDDYIKRIAYASSFGVDSWEYNTSQTLKCRDLVKKFDAISVREFSGIDLCRQHLHTSAEFMPDPTLLLSADEYIKLLKIPPPKKPAGGVFTYILDKNIEKQQLITKAIETTKLLPFSSQPNLSLTQDSSKKVDDYIFPKVEEWVKSFSSASFVITDSFHGCVFSIIFNKPFLVIGNPQRGLARFSSLLKLFNLESRMITNKDQITQSNIFTEIDWASINEIIDNNKSMGIEFLKKNLA